MGWGCSTRILAIRHGETAWNQQARIQGFLDIGLNDTGRRQAAQLAEALAGETLDAVYSSDLSRARDTAQALASGRGLPLKLDEALRERRFGIFEGLSFAEIETRHPEDCRRWRQRDPDFGPVGGERLCDFYDRCVAAFTRLSEAHPGGAIAVVSHGGVLDCLYRAATQLGLQAPRTWSVANTSVNRVLYTGEGFTLTGWGDVQHLEAPPLDAGVGQGTRVLDEGSDGGRAA
jgi:probable phosphoglycerate mutase